MNRIIITLKDGRIFEYKDKYYWGYEERLNDDRTPFITIGNFILRKEEISTIEVIKEDIPSEEVTNNE